MLGELRSRLRSIAMGGLRCHILGAGIALIAALTICPAAAQERQRVNFDQAPAIEGPVVRFIYAIPSDGEDRRYDVIGHFDNSILVAQAWIASKLDGLKLRLARRDGTPEVLFARLSKLDREYLLYGAYMATQIGRELQRMGKVPADSRYLLFYDGMGPGVCGNSPQQPDNTGVIGAKYLRGINPNGAPCAVSRLRSRDDPPGYFEWGMVHEMFHLIGAVPRCAPHYLAIGHVSDDPHDIMYTGPEYWRPSAIDAAHDDYYLHGRPDCPDLARNRYLERSP